MPIVSLRYAASLTREQARRAWTEGQRRYWIATPDFTTFFPIGRQPAIYPLRINIDLPLGSYVLGCGYGQCKLRKRFDIDLMGVHWL